MIYAYIGVAVVVGLLIGLVTLSVMWTARTVGKSIRSRSLTILSTYDGLLEQRSRDLRAMDDSLRQGEEKLQKAEAAPEPVAAVQPAAPTQAVPALMQTVERFTATPYQESGAADVYRTIRRGFAYRPEQVLQELSIPMDGRGAGAACQLLQQLSYDAVYELSTLDREQQYELLSQVLTGPSRRLLDQYAEKHPQFDCISFYDSIRAVAAMEPGPVCLRVTPEDAAGSRFKNVNVIADEDICEGFQIEADNVLYDYAIRMDEIG